MRGIQFLVSYDPVRGSSGQTNLCEEWAGHQNNDQIHLSNASGVASKDKSIYFRFRTKTTSIVVSTSTGEPFQIVGSYCHWRTASRVAGTNSFGPEITSIWTTDPSRAMVACNLTVPSMDLVFASLGYTGCTRCLSLAAISFPSTRTRGVGGSSVRMGPVEPECRVPGNEEPNTEQIAERRTNLIFMARSPIDSNY